MKTAVAMATGVGAQGRHDGRPEEHGGRAEVFVSVEPVRRREKRQPFFPQSRHAPGEKVDN